MSLTLIQRFYEIAKQTSEAPALIVPMEGRFQELPWWFVKSKAKHFGLGLKQEGALRGDYFYLFPGERPNWVYAELGALTMELQTLVLPQNLPISGLETLFKRFPPAFVMTHADQYPKIAPALKGQKSLRRLIIDSDQLKLGAQAGIAPLSFREVFNSGIIHESRHHPAYREHRRSLHDQSLLSPIQVRPDGVIVDQALSFADLNRLSANLSRKSKQKKIRRIFAGGDMAVTLIRAACLYWPLSLGLCSVLPESGEARLPQIRATQSSAALLSASDLSALERWAADQPALSKKKFWDRLRLKWSRRQQFGPKFQALLSVLEIPAALRAVLENSGRIALVEVKAEDFNA